jgi:hypothetical protein
MKKALGVVKRRWFALESHDYIKVMVVPDIDKLRRSNSNPARPYIMRFAVCRLVYH